MPDSNRDLKKARAQGTAHKSRLEPDLTIPDTETGPDNWGGADRRRPRERGALPVFGGANWIVLWFVITLGVASGNLLAGYITSLALDYQLRTTLSSLREDSEEASSRAERDLRESAARRAAEQHERRRESDRGQTLARQCNEWRNAHRELDTYTTAQNVEKYCGAYHEYLQTGRIAID